MVATRVDYSLYIYATLLNFAPEGDYVSQTFLVDIYLCASAVFEVYHLCCKVMTFFSQS